MLSCFVVAFGVYVELHTDSATAVSRSLLHKDRYFKSLRDEIRNATVLTSVEVWQWPESQSVSIDIAEVSCP